ncbi:hypothetical protein K450DRAFT_253122 [Umbelopsis ramanniana AG]|uniref:Transcription factor TFIIIC triple barrel domain-containing protein n=1 Tax=Umbelopsis ramanniana AG TaxID=1314678 RepID=A0AAD5E5R8_UMBRA|nr:uncharacterized protein K450DRAFT_253122 [Umbelopsis ramanniana AG]KAI8577159.1 hypothetical protein K450DRAFT_253122 [Umbelopsis ramanniana AG]
MTKTGSDENVITETQYILLDLGENAPDDIVESGETSGGYSLIGLDTPTPYLQLGSEIYQGEFDETIGSNLFLEKVPKNEGGYIPKAINNEDRSFSLSFAGATSKTIKFRKVNLTKKDEGAPIPAENDVEDHPDTMGEPSKKEDKHDDSFVYWTA